MPERARTVSADRLSLNPLMLGLQRQQARETADGSEPPGDAAVRASKGVARDVEGLRIAPHPAADVMDSAAGVADVGRQPRFGLRRLRANDQQRREAAGGQAGEQPDSHQPAELLPTRSHKSPHIEVVHLW